MESTLDCVRLYDIALPDGLAKQSLYEAAIHVLMSADHRLAHRDAVFLDELQDDPLIQVESTPAGPHAMRVLDRLGLSTHVSYRTGEYELMRSMVARNLGYSLMIHRPSCDVSYEGRRLVHMPITPQHPTERVAGGDKPEPACSRADPVFAGTYRQRTPIEETECGVHVCRESGLTVLIRR